MIKFRVPVAEGGEINTVEILLISPEIRAMVDNILYISVYGHKAMFEERVPPANSIGFAQVALNFSREKEDDFFASWKDYRASVRHPLKVKEGELDAHKNQS